MEENYNKKEHFEEIVSLAAAFALTVSLAVCAENSKTPVVFAAISNPVAAELTDIDYVTGNSDALNTEFIMDISAPTV